MALAGLLIQDPSNRGPGVTSPVLNLERVQGMQRSVVGHKTRLVVNMWLVNMYICLK